jgi:large subunit ribosomal protein L10e
MYMEALRRAQYKFPGRQKIIVSKKWGFTNVAKEDYLKLKDKKKILQCVIFHYYYYIFAYHLF